MMLEKSHKDGMRCSEVLHSVAVMLSHVTLEQHYNAYNSILHNILCNFWYAEHVYYYLLFIRWRINQSNHRIVTNLL